MTRDPVGLAVAGLGASSSTGASVITAGMLLYRSVLQNHTQADIGAGFAVITATLLMGVGTAVAVGVGLTRELGEIWRRAVIGGLSVFGTSLLAGLAAPVDGIAGKFGLAAYLGALIALAAKSWRAAIHAANR